MKKTIISLSLLVTSCMLGTAATVLKLTLDNGTTPTFVLAERPVVTFPDANMLITTSEVSTSYPRASVVKMQFDEEDAAALDKITDAKDTFTYLNGIIHMPEEDIYVYDVTGNLRLKGHDTLSVYELPKGIYIVKTSNHSIKIVKK